MRTNSHFVALKSGGGYAYLSYPLKLRLYVCVWWMLRVTTWRCLTYPVVSRCPASHWRSPWTCWSPRLYTRTAALAHRGAAAPHRWVVSSWWCCCQESTFCTSARRTSPASHALSMYHHSITAHHSVAEKLSDVFQSISPSPPIDIIWAMAVVWREYYQNCSVLCCVRQLCTMVCTQIWAVLKFTFSYRVKLNKEDAVDRCKWRKVINEVRWPGWVWAGECFFWYRPTWVVPDKRPVKWLLLLL